MADEENTEGGGDSGGGGEASGKNPLVALLLVLNMVALSVVAYFQYSFMQMEANRPDLSHLLSEEKISEDAAAEAKAIETIKKDNLFPLDKFTVNLAQGDGPRRFLRVSPVLKMSQNSKPEEFEARKPQIRDAIISILNSKRPEDLLKREGKQYLKEEIKAAINSFLIDGKIMDIYYVGFQIN